MMDQQTDNYKKVALWERLKNGYNPMTEGVKWTENYSDKLDKIWSRIPSVIGSVIATLAVFALGATLKGEWILIMVHFIKQIGYSFYDGNNQMTNDSSIDNSTTQLKWEDFTLEKFKLQHLTFFCISASVFSYVMYFSIGGFIHWYFYVRQRDKAHEWKCQPEKWLSPELERHEILLGSLSLIFTSFISGIVSCYAYNGGEWLTIYYEWNKYGWWWFFLQFPVIFIYQDYGTYLTHRIYHTPFLYKHFHKLHHKYKQPTAFSVTAIHPVEVVHIQLMLLLPIFLFPVHWLPFYVIAMYVYYHGIIGHSGVNFKACWWQPWQPPVMFHDNHHQYFHVNFGFNIFYWDILHGTYRQKDRVYTEDIFYGKGKSLNEVSAEVLLNDIAERKSENPLAYKSNKNEYEITEEDLSNKNIKLKIK